MDLSPIGSRIKAAREKKKITQQELAELLDMSTTHISVIERGVKPPIIRKMLLVVKYQNSYQSYLKRKKKCIRQYLTLFALENL